MAIIPVPTTRVSDMLFRSRLLGQIQFDQHEVFRIQQQISTGRRITRPGEDPPAGVRAIGLQRLIERKVQVRSNLSTNQSYLTASDAALSNVSNLLAEARGLAVSVTGDTATAAQRAAVVNQINGTLEQLVGVGNTQFRGRYLFAGSRTGETPFTLEERLVRYNGNERAVRSYGDLDELFATNIDGDEVFGALSREVRGTADLNPIVTADTRLGDLRLGHGVVPGSIRISDGTNTSFVDLSSAKTIGDVAELIEANPPAGRELTVNVTATGLTVAIDTAGGGTFSIREVTGGSTAKQLGILSENGAGTTPIVGQDLNPRLTLTTQLRDILGTRATAALTLAGTDNDLVIEAVQRGTAYNGVAIQFVDDDAVRAGPGAQSGNEIVQYSSVAVAARAAVEGTASPNNDLLLTATSTGTALNNTNVELIARPPDAAGVLVSFDSINKVYTISVEAGVSTAADVASAVTADGGLGGPFTAALDTSVDATNDGSYVYQLGDTNVAAGNTSNSGGAANTLFIHVERDETTADDIVAAVNGDPLVSPLFTARLDIRDSATAMTYGDGIVDFAATATTTGGSGIEFDQASGLVINNGGADHTIDLSTAETIEDLLNALNGSTADVSAEISANGRSLDVRSRISGADFSIGENGGSTATELGLRSFTATTQLSELNYGRGVRVDDGVDFLIQRGDGVDLAVDLSGAQTVGDVLTAINTHALNPPGPGQVIARLALVGNGIELVEDPPGGVRPLAVRDQNLAHTAEDLGWLPPGAVTSDPPATVGTASVIASGELRPLETAGVFHSLFRLTEALAANDLREIERAVAMLDEDLERVNLARGDVGGRQQVLDVLTDRVEVETIELKSALSQEIDVDLAQAVSDLVGRQAALEASLRLAAQTLQMSLMDFL